MWAIQNRDLTNVLQAFVSERAEELRARPGDSHPILTSVPETLDSQQSSEAFFLQAAALVGVRIVRRELDANDGSMTVEVEVVPGDDPTPSFIPRLTAVPCS